ncbi:conserved hypothetical protein [Bosea sp. 62]|uniref:hypothetical protein n=1 Tax=unclassified Bosea (in: a-proteobacteria) TaxID=2653178 RepID=UPI00125B3CA6|nr:MULTISPECIES: hypothetical protein [unclassified Bosea (in: a-proteobacteria)]CAD5251989.1 conserved hypothetical protein [Bosea sp. 21B]CAD5261172.1 conserved hypothetical protein [Bosea sp. 7B]CAD5273532.1 conserved hypothetical protein [Bosea sp. 46]VVT43410.1 conserved hypothetical protein [Bosea sp. EC-HK365B]VXB27618.1 conserved hypothetical protein [Bosea sp. 29B]
MPNADALMISSYEERKAAVLRAAQLISSARGSDGEREFELLTEAIAEFDIRQEALGYIEIPPAFMQFLSHGHQNRTSSSRR